MLINEADLEIRMARTFDAPLALVFRVYTDPALLPQWWGPRRLTTTVETMELRPGGQWRFVQHDAQGNEYAFHGVFQEITPPTRLVYTFEFEGIGPGHALTETVLFEEHNGKTIVTAIDRFQSADDMHGMVDSGMEAGAQESFDRMEELLRSQS
jgi:uncharacterized protein YndB with AHSA1/START domain